MDENTEAYDYAVRLAVELSERHASAAKFEPLPTLIGVLTQIDHMTVGLVPRVVRGGIGE